MNKTGVNNWAQSCGISGWKTRRWGLEILIYTVEMTLMWLYFNMILGKIVFFRLF